MLRTYLILLLAIVFEVLGTSALVRTDGFTRLWPSVVTVLCYGAAFWLLSLTVRVMPTGIVYAVWSGLGIVLIALVAWLWQGQRLDTPAVLGLGLILAGVVVINVFSSTVTH